MIQPTAYNIVYEDLKRKIITGIYRPGAKIPTVNELCEIYKTSDLTIRKSLQLLKKDGLITTVKRIGIFVSELKEKQFTWHFQEKTSLKSEIDRTEILSVTPHEGNEEQAADFPELQGRAYVKMERLYYVNQVLPLLYQVDALILQSPEKASKENTADWLNRMDRILNNFALKKQLTFVLDNEQADIKKRLYLLEHMGMYRIQKKYYNEEDSLMALSELYIPSSELDITMQI